MHSHSCCLFSGATAPEKAQRHSSVTALAVCARVCLVFVASVVTRVCQASTDSLIVMHVIVTQADLKRIPARPARMCASAMTLDSVSVR